MIGIAIPPDMGRAGCGVGSGPGYGRIIDRCFLFWRHDHDEQQF